MDKKKKETCQCEDCTCDGSCDCTDDNPCSCSCESEELIDNSQEMWRDAWRLPVSENCWAHEV